MDFPYICNRYFIDKDGNPTTIPEEIVAERVEYTDGSYVIRPILQNEQQN